MAEGLLHRNRCVESISWVYPTPLTAASIISLAYRSRSRWCKVVVERPPEDGRGGLQNKLNAAELLLGRLGHASVGRVRRAEPARRAVEWCYVSREGDRPKPRPGQPITIVSFVRAVCDVHVCVAWDVNDIRPGGSRCEVSVGDTKVCEVGIELISCSGQNPDIGSSRGREAGTDETCELVCV